MAKQFLTTFEAAKILSVTPDSVLKWIKSGILKARRTPGGHHRIARESIDELLSQNSKGKAESSKQKFLYCWEFNSTNRNCTAECQDCLVYKICAKGCYKISNLAENLGHLQLFCESTCEKCDYYKFIHHIH